MFKKITVFIFSLALLLNIYGCVALLAGAAAGTGTAVWLSGKLTQQFNASYEQTINAAERALNSLKLEMTRKVKEVNITQLRSQYSDGKEIWIDIRKVARDSTRVEIRVGMVSSDKAAADMILKAIRSYL